MAVTNVEPVVMDIKELVLELTAEIHRTVKPKLGLAASREVVGAAVAGDATFFIDELAEEVVESRLRSIGDIAYYSEDKGLAVWGRPEYVLVVDPIDGTRPAAAGLESACVSVAAARYSDRPLMRDVVLGVVQEIKLDSLFVAERGKGVEITGPGGQPMEPKLSANENLDRLFWSIGFRGRPARILVEVLGDLIDRSSVDGSVFDIGSACFSLTRLITGQFDCYIDIGRRIIQEIPGTLDIFKGVGKGHALNNNPYDVAAAALVVSEGGGVVTDGHGGTVEDRPIVGSGGDYQFSMVASSNPSVHAQVLEAVDEGIAKLKHAFRSNDL